MANLERANRIRVVRARLKREMRGAGAHGRRLLNMVIVRDTYGLEHSTGIPLEAGDLDTAKAFDVLRWGPGIGRSKADRILTKARISPSKTIGGLSDRQRTELLELIPQLAPATNENGGRTR